MHDHSQGPSGSLAELAFTLWGFAWTHTVNPSLPSTPTPAVLTSLTETTPLLRPSHSWSTQPNPDPFLGVSLNSDTAGCRETGASSAAELRAEGEVETKTVFPVPQIWLYTLFACSPLLANRTGPDFQQTALCFSGSHGRARPSLIHRRDGESHHSALPNVLLNAQKWLHQG